MSKYNFKILFFVIFLLQTTNPVFSQTFPNEKVASKNCSNPNEVAVFLFPEEYTNKKEYSDKSLWKCLPVKKNKLVAN